MSERTYLPMLGQPSERRDAARNREILLEAAHRLVDHCGVDAVTMDAVAHEAGVGKGTVFRRFENRAGLMAALLNHSEADWQGRVMGGPPPLGPGAEPFERLLAFGTSRMELNLRHAALIRAAGGSGNSPYAAFSFTATHVRYLLGELRVPGDIALLATALLAPLEVVILEQQTTIEGMSLARVSAGWQDLAARIVGSRGQSTDSRTRTS